MRWKLLVGALQVLRTQRTPLAPAGCDCFILAVISVRFGDPNLVSWPAPPWSPSSTLTTPAGRSPAMPSRAAGRGYTGVKGLNALLATRRTPLSAPVIAATRLRQGATNSVRGAVKLFADALATARRADLHAGRRLSAGVPGQTN